MAKKKGEGAPKSIILSKIPEDVWLRICGVKVTILGKNKNRASVSHQEAIYKLILNNCQ